MATSRTIIIAGAGIGGLTAALALARRGFRAVVLDQAERLEETGAGIQLSPNATRILGQLGVTDRLRPLATAPTAIRVQRAHNGSQIVRIPLSDCEETYGSPYWVMHRGDLQAALIAACREQPDISLELGARVETFATHSNGVTVKAMRGQSAVDAQGVGLVGADGIWSMVRTGIEGVTPPKFTKRVAWRALVPADMAPPQMREPEITLWLGRKGHIAHYPVQSGRAINVVAIAADTWTDTTASLTGDQGVRDILFDLTQRATRNRSAVFAQTLLTHIEGKAPLLRRSHRDAGFMVLLAPDVPAVLLEMGFVSNPDDEARLRDPAGPTDVRRRPCGR